MTWCKLETHFDLICKHALCNKQGFSYIIIFLINFGFKMKKVYAYHTFRNQFCKNNRFLKQTIHTLQVLIELHVIILILKDAIFLNSFILLYVSNK